MFTILELSKSKKYSSTVLQRQNRLRDFKLEKWRFWNPRENQDGGAAEKEERPYNGRKRL
jgi:hypothetical protein